MHTALSDAASEAAHLPDEELFRRIGVVAASQSDPDRLGDLRPVEPMLAESFGQEADFVGIGRAFAEKVNVQAHELVCGSGDDYKDEREEFQKALGESVEALSKAIAGFLVATGVGLPAAAVAWVAGVIAKMIVKAGGDVLCQAWKVPAPAAGVPG